MPRTSLLIGALVIQVVVVTVMLVSAVMPLWTGTDIVIVARPVDPRDLMRGDYVALDYDIDHVRIDTLKTDLVPGDHVRYGDVLYVTLQPNDSSVTATGIYRAEPSSGLFLKGRCTDPETITENTGARASMIHMNYGINEYYTDPETAQRLDRTLQRSKGLPIHIMIDSHGNARIRQLGTDSN
jgi:uncharacterized membrane-anchored protein